VGGGVGLDEVGPGVEGEVAACADGDFEDVAPRAGGELAAEAADAGEALGEVEVEVEGFRSLAELVGGEVGG